MLRSLVHFATNDYMGGNMSEEIIDKINAGMLNEIISVIEHIRRVDNVTYIDAITDYCERHGYDIAAVGTKLAKDPTMKARIQREAEQANMIEPINRLPM